MLSGVIPAADAVVCPLEWQNTGADGKAVRPAVGSRGKHLTNGYRDRTDIHLPWIKAAAYEKTRVK